KATLINFRFFACWKASLGYGLFAIITISASLLRSASSFVSVVFSLLYTNSWLAFSKGLANFSFNGFGILKGSNSFIITSIFYLSIFILFFLIIRLFYD